MRTRFQAALAPVIAVDRRSAAPIHRQVYDAFRAMILECRLQPGQQIPSTRTLAADLGISRIPALDAYAQLLAEGYIESRHGAGTFVTRLLPDQQPAARPTRRASVSPGSMVISHAAQRVPMMKAAPWIRGTGAFSVGQLAYDHFPFRAWSDLLARHARRVDAGSMNYPDPLGYKPFREVVSAYLRTARAVDCDASQIMVVNGSQQALQIAALVLLDPDSSVWIEEPGYDLLRYALTLAGCRLVPVPVDREGLNVSAGTRLCRNARAAFVTPSHQYPLGATMSAARRVQLLDWAHRFNSWIVEDDYDSEYRYESMPIASLQGLDRGQRVIYIGTFSKTLFPALRLGYIVIPPPLVDRFAAVRRACDLGAPHIYQAALADFINDGHFGRHVRRTRLLYAERHGGLVSALREEFGSELEIHGADAGMHVVVTLPRGLWDRPISARAAREKLWLWPLSSTYLRAKPRQGFILGFGSTKATDMRRQVQRMGRVIGA
jgi:GntR family transcriptional regulator/MocR family aminotransferase